MKEIQKELIEDFLNISNSSQRKKIKNAMTKFEKYLFDTEKDMQENIYDVYIKDFYSILDMFISTSKRNKHFFIGSTIVEPVLSRIAELDNYHIYDAVVASKALARVIDYKKACILADTIMEKSEIYKDNPLYKSIKISTYVNVTFSILNTKFLPENTWETDQDVKKVFFERVEMAKEHFSDTNDDIMLNLMCIIQHLATEDKSLSRFYLKALKEVAPEEVYEEFRVFYFDHINYLEEVKQDRETKRREEEYYYLTKNNENAAKYNHALAIISTCQHKGTPKQVDFLLKDYSKKLNLTKEQLLYLSAMFEKEVSENKFLRKRYNNLFKLESLNFPDI